MTATVNRWVSRAVVTAVLAAGVLACAPGERTGGVVLVETRPVNGALVKLGNDTIGITPCRIEGYPPGITGITLLHEDFQRTSELIEIPEDGEVTVTVELQELSGYLTVTSRPRHAVVYLDETIELGRTPMRRRPIPIGEHTYSVQFENYRTASGTIAVEDGLHYRFHHELTPLDGRVTITSRPTKADIYVNNQPLAQKTPAKLNLSPGDYVIAVHTDGHIMAEKTLRVMANQDYDLEIELIEGNVPPGMVLVPAGEFIFGKDNEAPDERPAKRVYLPDYYIDKFEVTNAQFKQVFPNHEFGEKEGNLPARGVTWKQAAAYAEAVGKRLPTEEEWEKAARGVDGREFPWGNSFEADRLVYSGSRGASGPKPVGAYLAGASPYGCMDMSGNVYEWTADWYEPYPGNPVIEATYGQIYKVLRGGSYRSKPYETRACRRHYDKPANAREDYGFRCVQDVSE